MHKKGKIVIAGGSGFFGKHLINFFANDYQIVVFTRGKSEIENEINYVNWDAKSIGDWTNELEGSNALINLTGKSINCRFTETNKKELLSSRINSTQVLLEAIEQLENPPSIWLNASAGAMYKVKNVSNTENDKDYNDDFLADMSLRWEEAFYKNELPNTKRVAMRISLLLGKDGGVFPVWKKITKLFLGGKVGSGKQIVSWMHVKDACRAVEFLINNKIEGPVNFSTNHPVSNCDLMKTLRKQLEIPFGFPAPEIGVKLGGMFLQTEPSLLLNSVNFIPERLINEGFKFEYENIKETFDNLK